MTSPTTDRDDAPRRRLRDEVGRFLAVGGVATIISLVGFNVLVHGTFEGPGPLHTRPIEAYVLVNVVAGIVAYAGMRRWAFKHREVSGPVSGPVSFFAIGAVTMVVPVLCLAVSRYALNLTDPISDNVSANVIGLGLGNLLRFWAFRVWVFRAPERPAGGSS